MGIRIVKSAVLTVVIAVYGLLAQTFTDFRFSAAEVGWNQDLVGVVNNQNRTITFETQRWIENIGRLRASFTIDGGGQVAVGGTAQTSGQSANDFRKNVVYTINNNTQYTVSFVSPQATGLPVMVINTVNSAPINSKEVYTDIESVSLIDPNNTQHNILRYRPDIARPDRDRPNDQIRGRGNATWHMPQWNMNYPKKPYRLRFNERVSLFGLERARNWILLAEYRDPSYIFTPLTFYVGKNIFEMPFTHSYFHVHLYLNGDYRGLYGLTEHKQVNPGRIDIDPEFGWHVNIDEYYDEDPKFRTNNYNLPVMIKSPEPESNDKDINNPAFQFVKNDLNELTRLMESWDFPENGYRNLIDMRTFVNYLLVSDIIRNFEELGGPKSMQAYKDWGGKISLGPLWDFDCGFGYNYQSTHEYFRDHWGFIDKHPFLRRFYDDPVFRSELRKRWDEKYQQVRNATAQIDAIAEKIRPAVSEDAKRWYDRNNFDANRGYVGMQYDTNHVAVTNRLKEWWRQRVEWLNSEITNQYQVLSIVGGLSSRRVSSRPSIAVSGRMLNISSPNNAELKIRVFDVRGKTVAKFNTAGSAKISLAKIPAGRYFVDVEARGAGVRQTTPVIVK